MKALVLHGILGSGRNWRGFCRQLHQEAPDWSFLTPDLRCHGSSPPSAPPHDLDACADDIDAALDEEPDAVIGHSFGGKVALAWAARHGRGQRVIVLDSPPWAGTPPPVEMGTPAWIITELQRVATPAADRSRVRSHLLEAGLPEGIVAWLLTSLRKHDDGWRWAYDLDGIHALLMDYFRRDFLPFMSNYSGEIHVVRAERSDRWNDAQWSQLHQVAKPHIVRNAGHWLHVDNPIETRALLVSILSKA
jgi:esterase